MNAIVMIGYAVGNSAGPQYWKKEYQPRYASPLSAYPIIRVLDVELNWWQEPYTMGDLVGVLGGDCCAYDGYEGVFGEGE